MYFETTLFSKLFFLNNFFWTRECSLDPVKKYPLFFGLKFGKNIGNCFFFFNGMSTHIFLGTGNFMFDNHAKVIAKNPKIFRSNSDNTFFPKEVSLENVIWSRSMQFSQLCQKILSNYKIFLFELQEEIWKLWFCKILLFSTAPSGQVYYSFRN